MTALASISARPTRSSPSPTGTAARVHRFARDGQSLEAVRTTLSFRRNPARGGLPLAEAGPWAIQDFIDSPEDTRFLQSFKSFAASASFTDTAVFTSRYKFEDLLQAFLGRLRDHAGISDFPKRIVIGRPVTFAGQNPDDALAQRRYETALRGLGFTDITYVLEPVAAAHFYAQGLTRDAVDPRRRFRRRHQRLLGPALQGVAQGHQRRGAGPQRNWNRRRQFRLSHHRQCRVAAARQARDLQELGKDASRAHPLFCKLLALERAVPHAAPGSAARIARPCPQQQFARRIAIAGRPHRRRCQL